MSIDWDKERSVRRLAAEDKSEPLIYLLLPEMVRLLSSIKDSRQKMFFSTLWHTGAKTNEVLSLRASDIHFYNHYVKLTISGRKIKSRKDLFVYDTKYVKALNRYINANKFKGRALLWDVTRQTAARWLIAILNNKALANSGFKKYKITLLTFQHSFAINWLLHSAPAHMLVEIMDFKRADKVGQYIKHLTDKKEAAYKRVRFS